MFFRNVAVVSVSGVLLIAGCGGTAAAPQSPIFTHFGSSQFDRFTDLESPQDAVRGAPGLYLATDDGLYLQGESQTERVTGLPSENVTALALVTGSDVAAATPLGIALVTGAVARPIPSPEDAGTIHQLLWHEGALWVCAGTGIFRKAEADWEPVYGDAGCTTLRGAPEGGLWAGTTRGLLRVTAEGTAIHGPTSGIPETYVRGVVPVGEGEVLTLLSGPSASLLGWLHNGQWFGYSLTETSIAQSLGDLVGLVEVQGRGVLLQGTRGSAYIAPTGIGTDLTAMHASPASPMTRSEGEQGASTPRAASSESNELRPPQSFAPLNATRLPTAPALRLVPSSHLNLPGPITMVREQPGQAAIRSTWLMVRNQGVVELGPEGMRSSFATRSLVGPMSEDDPAGGRGPNSIQLASDLSGEIWVRAIDGRIGHMRADGIHVLRTPQNFVPQTIAQGPRGVYLIGLLRDQPQTVSVVVSEGSRFAPLFDRTLNITPSRITFAAVPSADTLVIGLEVGGTPRGAAVLNTSAETILYHHRGANREASELTLNDEVTGVAVDSDARLWFPSLLGVTRIDAHQAIVFDSSRGVRGEVVFDVAPSPGSMWVASAEGLARYHDQRFDYAIPASARSLRPRAIATDLDGRLFGVGDFGLLMIDAEDAFVVTEGLPETRFRSVETDSANRLYLLGDQALWVSSRPSR